MQTRTTIALLVLAGAVPLSAQVSTRERVRDRVIYGDGSGRVDTRTGGAGGIGDIIFGRTSTTGTARTKVPRGHLPPRGMCRVWIDGVPPGQQPPVTSCAQAERDRVQYGTRARVIYGDVESFPGKGKGKYKNRRANGESIRDCSVRDVVVIGGQQRDVCRGGNVIRDRNGNVIRRDDVYRRGTYGVRGDHDSDWDDDSDRGKRGTFKNKLRGKGKRGD